MSDPLKRSSDLSLLHPIARRKVQRVQAALESEGIPLKVFEVWRSPERQADLFAQGRTKPGSIVTYARPWTSYHQYGLAVDFVLFQNGQWNWDDDGPKAKWWKRMHELGKENGLMRLDFETPHLQLAGVSSADLHAGHYPRGGDQSWFDNIRAAIRDWHGSPSAPPPPAPPDGTEPDEAEHAATLTEDSLSHRLAPEAVTLTNLLLATDTALREIADGDLVLLRRDGLRQAGVGSVQDAMNLLARQKPAYAINFGPNGQGRGFFGPQTERVMRQFQGDVGIGVDGKIGIDTIKALDAALNGLGAGSVGGADGGGGDADGSGPVFSPAKAGEFQPDAGATPVGSPATTTTPKWHGEFKGNKSDTTGSTFRSQTFSDGSVVREGVETLSAAREGKSLGAREARQRRVTRGTATSIWQDGYTHRPRPMPIAHLESNFGGFGGAPDVVKGKSTCFGKFDPIDEGTGAPALGVFQTNSDGFGASVKLSRLKATFGPQWAKNPKLQTSVVEVFNPRNGRFARVPLVDVGPAEHLTAELDLTWVLDQYLNTQGSAQVQFRVVVE